MKRNIKTLSIIAFALLLTGCGNNIYKEDLPDNAIAFNMGEYIDTENDNDGYATIEYNGRIYMPYGTIGKTLKQESINSCIGYVVQDGVSDTQRRVYTLVDDTNNNYLMVYYTYTTLMNQPDFLRAVDTKGKDIYTPDYIDSLEYAYWN